jgi:Family of unknown function (DUF5677)
MFEDIRPKIKNELIDQLAREVKEKGITEKKADQLANGCGLQILYDSMYRLFSQDVHSAPKAIEGYCNFNDQSELIGFLRGYEKEDINAELTAIPRVMYFGVFAINKLFNLGIDQELIDFDEKIRPLENPPTT